MSYGPAIPFSGTSQHKRSKRHVREIFSSTICDSQTLETTQIPINKSMNTLWLIHTTDCFIRMQIH